MGANSICIGSLGTFIGLIEECKMKTVGVFVYDTTSISSDPISEYEMGYFDLTKKQLLDVLKLAKEYEKLSK
jgi:hypothetical protein